MIEFTIKTSAEVEKFLGDVEKKIDNDLVVMARSGMVMLRSIDKNFKNQGRPTKWKGLAKMTKALRRKGKGKGVPQILQDSGRLKGSIAAKTSRHKTRVGTNVEYAQLMHFGGMSKGNTIQIKQHRRKITKAWGKPIKPKTITVKAHTMKIGPKRIPARPFVLFQREDIVAIEKLGLKHLEDATK